LRQASGHAAAPPRRDREFPSSDMDCHATLPLGHPTGGLYHTEAVLQCGISIGLRSAPGQKRKSTSVKGCVWSAPETGHQPFISYTP